MDSAVQRDSGAKKACDSDSAESMDGGRLTRPIPECKVKLQENTDTLDVRLSSRRIVLLGKSGIGKSAAGNTILGQEKFNSEMSSNSVTRECSEAHATVSGRSLSVVDTPGFFDTQMKPEDLNKAISRCVNLSIPGPHAFLIVFRVDDRFTEQELQIPHKIELMFGEDVLKYSIILFTYGDQLKRKTVEKLIGENIRLRDLVQKCGGRFHVFNNEAVNNRDQANELLQKIDSMVQRNGGGHYSNEMYEKAQKLRQEEEERRRREEEQKKQREKEKEEENERLRKEAERVQAQLKKLQEEKQREEEEKRQKKKRIWRYAAAAGIGAVIAGPIAAVAAGAAGAVAAASTLVGLVVGGISGAAGGAAGGAVIGVAVEAAVGDDQKKEKQQ